MQTKYTSFIGIATNCIQEANPSCNQRKKKSNCKVSMRRKPCTLVQHPGETVSVRNLLEREKLHYISINTTVVLTILEIWLEPNIKRDNFISLCASLNKYTNPSFIWKKLKRFKSRWNSSTTANQYSEEN